MQRYFLAGFLALTLTHPGSAVCIQHEEQPLTHARAAALLDALPDCIKAVDEPTLRVALRLRLAKLLWARKTAGSPEISEKLAMSAAADIQDHADKISGPYRQLFRRELMAALELNAPDLAARVRREWGKETVDDFDTAYELLKIEGGAQRAAEIARSSIHARHDFTSYGLQSLLSRLDETSPEIVTSLLVEMMTGIETAPNDFPVSALFTLAHNYLYRAATPQQLKARFLASLIRASSNPAALSERERSNAFVMLKANLPAIETMLPSLYAQANVEAAALLSLVPRQDVERGDAYRSVGNNAVDSVESAIDEAEKSQDAALKREFLQRAAQSALEAGKLRQAVDLALRADTGMDEEHVAQRDQFLGEVVQRATQKKDADTLAYAASKIDAPLPRASALQRLSLLQYDAQDAPLARDTLDAALKLVEGADDGVSKASAMLTLVNTSSKVNSQRVAELLPSAIKSINNIPSPKAEDAKGGETRQKHVEAMMQLTYYLPPLFERLVQQDELGSLSLADKLQRQELRAAALIGAFAGLERDAPKGTKDTRPN